MSLVALILILLSAGLHVFPHLALKRARDRTSFIWWTWCWASLIFLPASIIYWQPVPARVWAILTVSAVFEAFYYLAIARAYKEGDLSVVYPMARGSAPLLILIWSMLLLHERPTGGGIGGIALIVAGLCLINLPRGAALRHLARHLWQPATRWALAAGLCISAYTTIDKFGVGLLAPLLYTYLAMTMTLVWLTPSTLREVGWKGLLAEWRASRVSSLLAGVSAISAYALVLYVMQMGTPASYVGAVRELSVVLGAGAGILLLREDAAPGRLIGSALIAIGVAAIAVFG